MEVAVKEGNTIEYQHADRLGSNRFITDNNLNTDEFISLPFGQEVLSGNRFEFTGKEQDSNGLHFYGARYYDSNLGRFLSKDPIPASEAYSYVNNNPLNYVDPTGMQAEPQDKQFVIWGYGGNAPGQIDTSIPEADRPEYYLHRNGGNHFFTFYIRTWNPEDESWSPWMPVAWGNPENANVWNIPPNLPGVWTNSYESPFNPDYQYNGAMGVVRDFTASFGAYSFRAQMAGKQGYFVNRISQMGEPSDPFDVNPQAVNKVYISPVEGSDQLNIQPLEQTDTNPEPAQQSITPFQVFVTPNPSRVLTNVQITPTEDISFTVTIHDARGRLVRSFNSVQGRNGKTYMMDWDGTNNNGERVASGVYIGRIRSGINQGSTFKMTRVN